MENASVTFNGNVNVHFTGRNICFSFIHLILTTHSERWLFPSNINPSRRPVIHSDCFLQTLEVLYVRQVEDDKGSTYLLKGFSCSFRAVVCSV